jgi:hypothetical protein
MGISTNAYFGWGVALSTEGGWDGEAAWEAQKRLKDDGLDVKILAHCSSEDTMLAFVIASTATTAYRGYPKKIDPGVLRRWDPRWENQIRAAISIYIEEYLKRDEIRADDPDRYLSHLRVESDKFGWSLFSYLG